MFDWFDDLKRPGFFRRLLSEWRVRRLQIIVEERLKCVKRVAELNTLAATNPGIDYTGQIVAYCDMIVFYERKLIAAGIEI